nr:hypothetical protein [Nocardia sp. BMG51109]
MRIEPGRPNLMTSSCGTAHSGYTEHRVHPNTAARWPTGEGSRCPPSRRHGGKTHRPKRSRRPSTESR